MAEARVRGVYIGTVDAPERQRLFDADAAAVFMPPDRIVFLRGGKLYIQRFDPVTLMLDGEAVGSRRVLSWTDGRDRGIRLRRRVH